MTDMNDVSAALVAHANDTLALVHAITGQSPLPQEPCTVIAFGDNRNQWWAYTRTWSGHLVPHAPADGENHRQIDVEVIARRGSQFRVISRPVTHTGAGALDELLWDPAPITVASRTDRTLCGSCGGPGNLHWGDCTRKKADR